MQLVEHVEAVEVVSWFEPELKAGHILLRFGRGEGDMTSTSYIGDRLSVMPFQMQCRI